MQITVAKFLEELRTKKLLAPELEKVVRGEVDLEALIMTHPQETLTQELADLNTRKLSVDSAAVFFSSSINMRSI